MTAPKILLLDNYDSFTYNIAHIIRGQGIPCDVIKNDAITLPEVAAYDGVILSPGPGKPPEAGQTMAVIDRFWDIKPILGVCLGHQALAMAAGASLYRLPEVWHGKTSGIRHDGCGVFSGTPSPLRVMRYHSLAVEPDSLPATWLVSAATDDGVIMAMRHRSKPLYGVQFHPESVLTEHGEKLLMNFISTVQKSRLDVHSGMDVFLRL